MNQFRIHRDKQIPAVIDLLTQVLSNQHAFIETFLEELAKKNGEDFAEVEAKMKKRKAVYDGIFRDWILDNYGNLDVDDLIQ